jgi:nucleolin
MKSKKERRRLTPDGGGGADGTNAKDETMPAPPSTGGATTATTSGSNIATHDDAYGEAPPAASAYLEKNRRKRKRKRANKGKSETDRDEQEYGGDGDGDSLDDDRGPRDKGNGENRRKGQDRPDDPTDKNSGESGDEVARTVYLEGIPYEASEAQVRDFFRGLDLTSLRLPTWQDSGRLRGYGHATFRSVEDARTAVREFSGRTLDSSGSASSYSSRYLRIQPAKPPKHGQGAIVPASSSLSFSSEPSRTILLKNLSYDAGEDDVRQAMSGYGEIVEGGIRVARHNRTRNSKGFAYVEYRAIDSATRAYRAANVSSSGSGSGGCSQNVTGIAICGRTCVADYDHGTVQKSFRTHTGRLWKKQYGGRR